MQSSSYKQELNLNNKRDTSSLNHNSNNDDLVGSISKNKDDSKPAPKKRRKRNTVVCFPCKKRKIKCDRGKPCRQCCESNASNFCFYSSPQWALDTFLANNSAISTTNNNNNNGTNDSQDIDANKINDKESVLSPLANNNNNDENLTNNFTSEFNKINKIKDPSQKFALLLKHLQQVHQTINDLQGIDKSTLQLNKISQIEANVNSDNKILLDFHAPFNSLEIKRSSDLGSKPISTKALVCKDPYLSLIFKYYNARTINRKLLKNCYPGEKVTRGHESNIAHSVLDMIKINDDKIPPPQSILDKKKKNETILNFPVCISDPNIKNHKDLQEFLKNEILKLLTTIPVIYLKKYFINFWKFVYPTIPIFDQDEFLQTSTRIFGLDIMAVPFNDEDARIKEINLIETFDLIHVAIFLIMIRFSYLSIITQLNLQTTDRLLLRYFKVPPTFFSLANDCLSAYKPFRKSKIILLQYLTLIKSYSLFSVEDGEGSDLNQGTVLKNTVAILAKMMGMNRDPLNNIQIFNHCYGEASDKKTFIWRKLYWTLVTLDHKTSSLSGLISNFNETFMERFCDTQFPKPNPYFPNFKLETGICDFLTASNKVSIKFNKIVEDTSRLKDFVTLEEILVDMEEMEAQLDINQCTLSNMKKLNITNYTKDIEELEYHLFTDDILLTSLSNFSIIELNILVFNLQMSIYHSILIALENKQCKCSQETLNDIILRLITVVKRITDICHMYLNHEFREYILKLDYHLNRLVQVTVEKCCLIMVSTALKVCFTKPPINEEELKIRNETFKNCLIVMNEMGSLLFNSCGIKYYQGYKALINLRFVFKLLNYYPFESTSIAMIQFFISFYNFLQGKINEADLEVQEKIKKLFKKNSYERNVLLESTLADFMSSWSCSEVENKIYFENVEYDNSLNDTQLLIKMNEILSDYKAIKEQLFEFQDKNSSVLTNTGKKKTTNTNGDENSDIEKEIHHKSFDNITKNVTPNMQNFTIITEHSARNILNDSPATMMGLNTNNNSSNTLNDLFSEKSVTKNQQQIPSLLGDEKIVKYLIPGLNYVENKGEKLVDEDEEEEEEEGNGVNGINQDKISSSYETPAHTNNDINNYNDAMMNYGIDVLLGENELFPEDDPFFKLFQ